MDAPGFFESPLQRRVIRIHEQNRGPNSALQQAAQRRLSATGFAIEPDSVDYDPLVSNVGNFSMPTGDKPALLSFEEVSVLFHEFGHALHGLLADTIYEDSQSNILVDNLEQHPCQHACFRLF